MHNGTDYGTLNSKWPLYAPEDGCIVHVVQKSKTGYGNMIWLRIPRLGISVQLAHLDSIAVKQGQVVKEKTLLGYTGTTGDSTGIHDHVGLTKINSNVWLDPHAYEYYDPAPVVSPPPQKGVMKLIYRNIKGRDEYVKIWQKVLKDAGYYKGAIDGIFGLGTDAATKAYQKAKGLWVDGKAGERSWASAGYKCA